MSRFSTMIIESKVGDEDIQSIWEEAEDDICKNKL